MNKELILWISIIIAIIYLAILYMKGIKKKKMILNTIIAVIFVLLVNLIKIPLLSNANNEEKDEEVTTTITTKTTTTATTTTLLVTENPTTTKKITTTTKAKTTKITTTTVESTEAPDYTGTTSKGYKIETKNGITYIDGYLIANKTYSLPKSYNPGSLTSTTKSAASEMFDAFIAEKGVKMWAQSGFRSYDTQKSIYERYVNRDGQKAADRYSARPGHSEHQSGLAFDVCVTGYACISSGFNDTMPAQWLSENAHKYGFILRYPKGKEEITGYKHESWHFRYVGKELAEKLYNDGNWITMEEYFGIDSKYQ